MLSTREVLGVLAEANPGQRIDEERVRRAIRRGLVQPPSTVAGRFVWSESDLAVLASALGLQRRAPEEVPHGV